ncbi:hypothetical protein H9L39_19904 [Fusarium oxysporum f. sp. albedinis]|nr:hypothetical protein H9L39_19904 [Fusarium oxysporum f. sp. albedinis]
MISIQTSQCFMSAPVLSDDDGVWDNTAPLPNSTTAQSVAFFQDDLHGVQLRASLPAVRSDEWTADLNPLAHLWPSASSESLSAEAIQEVSSKENSGLGGIEGSPTSFIYQDTNGPDRTHNMLRDIIQEAEARPEAGTTLFSLSESGPVFQLSQHSYIQDLDGRGHNSESFGFQGGLKTWKQYVIDEPESNQAHLNIDIPETLHSPSTPCGTGYMNEALLVPGGDLVAYHKHSNISVPAHEDSHQVSLVRQVTDFPGSEKHFEAVEDKMTRNTETLTYSSQYQCWDHGCNGREFSRKGNFVRHQREKLKKDRIPCPHCSQTFKLKRSLPDHIRRFHAHMVNCSQLSSTS